MRTWPRRTKPSAPSPWPAATGGYGGLASNDQLPALDSSTAPVDDHTGGAERECGHRGHACQRCMTAARARALRSRATSAGRWPGDNLRLNTSGSEPGLPTARTFSRPTRSAASGNATLVIGSSPSVGSQLSDYSFSAPAIAPVGATVTPKALTINGITAADKVYDGSTAAAVQHRRGQRERVAGRRLGGGRQTRRDGRRHLRRRGRRQRQNGHPQQQLQW